MATGRKVLPVALHGGLRWSQSTAESASIIVVFVSSFTYPLVDRRTSVDCRDDDDSEDESLSHGGRQNHDNLYRVHMPSLYSCGSSYGSETSIPAAAHTVSNAPVTEYM